MRFSVSLKNNYEFRRLYAKGKSAAAPTLVIYLRRSKRPENRLGITVTTKLGKAVVRNRIRRRIRAIYRLHEEQLRCGFDLVVVARARSVDAPYSQLEKDFLTCCRRTGLINDEGQA